MDSPMSNVNIPRKYTLGGTKVEFPYSLKPYPSQLTCMSKAVTGARLGQNCLLESPTGSGKTMAMLCSLLAWQKQFREEAEQAAKEECARKMQELIEKENIRAAQIIQQAENPKQTTENTAEIDAHIPPSKAIDEIKKPTVAKNRMSHLDNWSDDEDDLEIISSSFDCDKGDSDDDFKSPKKKHMKKIGSEKSTPQSVKKQPAKIPKVKLVNDADSAEEESCDIPRRARVPKIFFATRTHKQIAQVVDELKRTPYGNAKMTILSSREHSCIKWLEEPFKNKTEMCKALLETRGQDDDQNRKGIQKKPGCAYKNNLAKYHIGQLMEAMELNEEPWDIEELVTGGRKFGICPYFAARDLMMSADIIFCPYNYIVDPLIRKSMNINLSDNIILFDEAHNIEDAFRESNSFTFTTKELEEAVKNCDLGTIISSRKTACAKLKESLCIFGNWMNGTSSKLRLEDSGSRERTFTFSGSQFANEIEVAGFDEKQFDLFMSSAEAVFSDEGGNSSAGRAQAEDDDDENKESHELKIGEDPKAVGKKEIEDMFKASPQLKTMVDGLKLVMTRVFSENLSNRNDYNVVLFETASKFYKEGPSEGGWQGKSALDVQVYLGLHIWCMNPAVGFSDFDQSRSVIVTSGTLSPMSSFQSELGAKFPHSLSTDHVISPSQVWVGSVACGPRGRAINGVYRNAVTIDYQDEVGLSILQICSVVPFGVLCFFPSYASLENVLKRWQMTGTWHKLTAMKDVIVEPRQVKDFADAMANFDDSIRRAESGRHQTQTGALLLAVCRGKVSEGIDFRDNHARAVITVSIPFPNVKDMNVKLKKQYNDKNQHRQLLPGNQWYEIQAFRAINQALGRCIRHKNDWGAIILLDDRFSPNSRATQSISKWAAKNLNYYDNWRDTFDSLTNFMKRMTENMGK
ncbi:Fanconi anemia group J protein homolog isoform X2 [Neocloeon triangulifer]|nr:Fanconi anemia group J protein homolog isoform X2 [Neocloeon triangulifer]